MYDSSKCWFNHPPVPVSRVIGGVFQAYGILTSSCRPPPTLHLLLSFPQGGKWMLLSARSRRICVGETSEAFRWKCSTTASNLRMKTEGRDRDLDKEGAPPAAGLSAPAEHPLPTRATQATTPPPPPPQTRVGEAAKRRRIACARVTNP